ncbi:MAG: flagellar motor protein MotB [Desulfobulbus sp.]|jgi:chemotaxis protein MotB
MARKQQPEKPANHERWLVSYGDLLTLLFAVFVTMYAMSQTDKQKIEEVAASYRAAFGLNSGNGARQPAFLPGAGPQVIMPLNPAPPATGGKKSASDRHAATRQDLRDMVVAFGQMFPVGETGPLANVVVNDRGLVISLKEAGCFASGSAELESEALGTLKKIGEILRPFNNRLSFEGHTDDLPIRSPLFPSNWELSTARATSLARHFIEVQQFMPQTISVTGYGQYRPLTSNATEEGRQMNRRVDIVFLLEEDPVIKAKEQPPLPF